MTEFQRFDGVLSPSWESPTRPGAANVGQFTRHFDGDNNLFFDGHVKWLKDEKIATNASHMRGNTL